MSRRSGGARRSKGRPERKSRSRPIKKTFLIACEGQETEWNYFDQMKREEKVRSRFAITVKRGKGGSRQQIVERAIHQMKGANQPFDKVYCVMDVERLESEESRKDLASAIELANEEGISLCLSNPAFEVWFLAHFERTSKMFRDCDAIVAELNKFWNREFGADYAKNDSHLRDKLRSRTHQAIDNAKMVFEQDHGNDATVEQCNSSTEVYQLVEALLETPNA